MHTTKSGIFHFWSSKCLEHTEFWFRRDFMCTTWRDPTRKVDPSRSQRKAVRGLWMQRAWAVWSPLVQIIAPTPADNLSFRKCIHCQSDANRHHSPNMGFVCGDLSPNWFQQWGGRLACFKTDKFFLGIPPAHPAWVYATSIAILGAIECICSYHWGPSHSMLNLYWWSTLLLILLISNLIFLCSTCMPACIWAMTTFQQLWCHDQRARGFIAELFRWRAPSQQKIPIVLECKIAKPKGKSAKCTVHVVLVPCRIREKGGAPRNRIAHGSLSHLTGHSGPEEKKTSWWTHQVCQHSCRRCPSLLMSLWKLVIECRWLMTWQMCRTETVKWVDSVLGRPLTDIDMLGGKTHGTLSFWAFLAHDLQNSAMTWQSCWIRMNGPRIGWIEPRWKALFIQLPTNKRAP